MASSPTERNWPRRVRALNDRRTRLEQRSVFVEGIRQVIAAHEGGHGFEAILVDPTRLRSDVAWEFIGEMQALGEPVVNLGREDFDRLSTRENPVGLAAVVRWAATDLRYVDAAPDGLYLAADNVRDPGNLGTMIRTVDAMGSAGLITHSGTDAGHPTAIRASLGSVFQVPVLYAPTHSELFYWASRSGIAVIGTSANADLDIVDAPISLPAIILVGNEGEGLAEETLDRCDLTVRIPMAGSASSLNVSVAAGIILYEIQRRLRAGA